MDNQLLDPRDHHKRRLGWGSLNPTVDWAAFVTVLTILRDTQYQVPRAHCKVWLSVRPKASLYPSA